MAKPKANTKTSHAPVFLCMANLYPPKIRGLMKEILAILRQLPLGFK
jgi:hypothetical protein